MDIAYILHSGFLVETAACNYLFDYYKGDLPPFDAAKPLVLLASHGHSDHYNPEVVGLLRARGVRDISAVLGKDIPTRRYPDGVPALRACADEAYALAHGARLETLRSTDSGVAFLLTTGEGVVYHAGDLNDWTWEGEPERDNRQMRGSYRHEVDRLRGRHIDVACVPLDPRQEAHYADGLLYFLAAVGATRVYPMHYWGQPEVIDRFLREYPQYRDIIQNTETTGREETPCGSR